ncbi:MAG TPA: glycosyl hydrolase family 65 protein [Jiangellales bacterium]|nr:glycosyl hydrolase family 65 protein [Jiangellales bacterium]
MTTWLLRYDGYDERQEPLREALCALGNGRFATRAAAPESRADGVHYPGTYAAGVFNRLAAEVGGQPVENESMVNLPDWQSLTFRVDDGPWCDVATGKLDGYVQELDIRRGVLMRRFRWTDPAGRTTVVAQRRLVSMADPFLAGLQTTVVPEDWSGRLTVRSGLDGRVANSGVARYRGLGDQHFELVDLGSTGPGTVALDVRTNQSQVLVSLAARHRVVVDGSHAATEETVVRDGAFVGVDLELDATQGRTVTIDKVVTLFTSRDRAITAPAEEARDKIDCAPDFEPLLERHVLTWDHLWERCHIEMVGHQRTETVLHLHLFHLLQSLSQHSVDLDVGIPARGLHGEAYRGHIFWDEMFVFPYLTLRMPELSRALLLYRWRRLPQARKAAHDAGYRGAMFPWQSGASGREETQRVHLNPKSGRWLPDHSHLQRHIGLAVAYNTWQYYEATGDRDFLASYGAEVLLEVARFFASLATYDRGDDRYDIRGVMGPDEYHDAYPWRDEPGLDNNAYTNVMTVWLMTKALALVRELPDRRRQELFDLLGLRRNELEQWEHLSRKMRLCFHEDGVLSQFEDYERLEEFPWGDYVERYADIARLDRILEAEGDTPNRYKVSKQADVLMLFFLLSTDELRAIIEQLGYDWDPLLLQRTVEYYRERTSHGSTLSKIVHSWVLARTDRKLAWDLFVEALESDISDVQGGTTPEGVHLGAMAGTIDLVQRGFTGLQLREERLWFEPRLPDELQELRFRLRYRQHYGIFVTVRHDSIVISGRRGGPARLRLRVAGQDIEIDPGGTREVPLPRP